MTKDKNRDDILYYWCCTVVKNEKLCIVGIMHVGTYYYSINIELMDNLIYEIQKNITMSPKSK